jgi:hypothetical protein
MPDAGEADFTAELAYSVLDNQMPSVNALRSRYSRRAATPASATLADDRSTGWNFDGGLTVLSLVLTIVIRLCLRGMVLDGQARYTVEREHGRVVDDKDGCEHYLFPK